VIVPLNARGRTLGAISLAFTRGSGRRYGPNHLALAEELAGRAALALDNAQLYLDTQAELAKRRQAHEELDRQHAFLQLLLDTTTAANEAPSFRSALRMALDHIRTHTRWPIGHAWLPAPEGHLESSELWSTDDPERFHALTAATREMAVPPGIGLPGRVLATREAVGIADLDADPGFLRARVVSELEVRAAFAFPVLAGTEVAAVLEFFSSRPIEPDAELLAVMSHVGVQLGRVAERERAEREVGEARERAEDALRTRDEVLRMAAHDLKNPIHTIRLAVSLLRETPLDPELLWRQLEVVGRTAEHMDRLVTGLLDLKRLEAGYGIPIEPRPTEVLALLARSGSLFESQATAKGVEIVREAPGAGPRVHADPDRALQVLWNLTGNAIKFTPAGGTVVVRAVEREGDILFSVRDTGPGIAPEDRARLFDPFWQDKRTARLGTGLGLPISRAIVEAHGGTIWVESVPGEGTTFHFTLPRAGPRRDPTTSQGGGGPKSKKKGQN
jgi:signal transduction histidine kinase